MDIHFSHIFSIAWISAISKKSQKPLNLKCLCIPIFFPYCGNSLFRYFGNCMDFCFTQNIWETQHFEIFAFFPYISCIMRIHFSHILGTVWISASSEVFKKSINLKCLCFPILFPYYGNPLFPCVGNCIDFCFKLKIPETLNFEMLVFSHIFSLLWEFTFLIFWELYVLMPHMKYVRNL